MKTLNLLATGLGLIAALAAAPASAQTTWNFGNGANCDIASNTPVLNCSVGTNNSVSVQGFAAAAGSTYVRGTLSDQGSSGIGFTATGETTVPPQHGIDNYDKHELILLDFGINRVVVNSFTTGWSYNDTDVSLLRWAGTGAPGSMPSMNVTTANLLSSGWVLVRAADIDGSTTNSNSTFGQNTLASNATVNAANSSSWWIISSYFGATTSTLNQGDDYFKLLSVHSTCVSNNAGGACYTEPPRGVPEPGSLALAGLALAGLVMSRRKRKAA